ncbi:MAG: hypothetical protein Q8S33_37925 [Myxococcales bacterium]|nr:hypothetical protein [Myxococcales bacterium]
MNPVSPPRAPERMLLRLALYFRPHVFGVLGSVAVVWMIRTLSVMGGSCRVLCYPPITIAMGVLGGLLGAQLYRNNHPLPSADDEEPSLVPLTGPARVRTRRPHLRRR